MFIVSMLSLLLRAPEERNVLLVRQLTIRFAPNGARINKAAGAINISLRWSEGTFSKLHLKLECAI